MPETNKKGGHAASPLMKASRMCGCLRLPALLLCNAISPYTFAEEKPLVTPYRQTVFNPAALSPPGWLEVETGWNNSQTADNTSHSRFSYTLKFAFTEKMGVLLGGDAFVDQTDLTGRRLSGSGDTFYLLKHKRTLSEENNSAFGMEYGFKAPTAKNGLGSGKTDHLLNGIYSTKLSGNTLDLNLNLTTLGNAQVGESRRQWGWSTTWSRPLNDTWGVATGLFGYTRQGTDPNSQILGTVSYAMNRRIAWDAGFAAGISPAAPKWSVFAGVSMLAGKLKQN